MPTVSFVSSKGGAGKTTSLLIFGTELCAYGASVSVIDADPNHPLTRWQALQPIPEKLRVVSADGGTIEDVIEAEAAKSQFVLVDLEGTENNAVIFSVVNSDFVVIPSQGSQLDIQEATKAIKLVRRSSKKLPEPIPFRVLLTRTNAAVRGKTLRHIEREIVDNEIPCLRTELNEREAFKTVFSAGGTLSDLDEKDVGGLKAARENAAAFAGELVELLRTERAAA